MIRDVSILLLVFISLLQMESYSSELSGKYYCTEGTKLKMFKGLFCLPSKYGVVFSDGKLIAKVLPEVVDMEQRLYHYGSITFH